jgi:hypothetical protein
VTSERYLPSSSSKFHTFIRGKREEKNKKEVQGEKI